MDKCVYSHAFYIQNKTTTKKLIEHLAIALKNVTRGLV